MRYRLFGQTGLRVSQLWLGTMTFGDAWGWGASADECRKVLDRYAEAGGNVVDTANRYTDGQAESIVGELLGSDRDRFVLSTKYTLLMHKGDVNSAGNQRKNLVQSLEASLRRLRTDYVDILWVHARDPHTPVAEVVRALDDLVRAGKVLYVAASDWPAWEVAQAVTMADLRGWTGFAGLQARYSLLTRDAERELWPMASGLGLTRVGWGPLAEGRLTGKYLRGDAGRLGSGGQGDPRVDRIVREVVAVADELGASPAQVALAWSAGHGVLPILGARSVTQLNDNLGCLDVALDESQRRRLDEASAIELGFPHDFLAEDGIDTIVRGDQRHLLDP